MVKFLPQKVLALSKELAKKNPKLQGNFLITEKIEGWYVYFEYTPEGGWQAPKSSAGREIPAFEHFRGVDLHKADYPIVLIAEAYIPDNIFQITNGIFNRSKGSYRCDDVVFVMHDLIIISLPHAPALPRFNILTHFNNSIPSNLEKNFQLNHILLASAYNEKLWYKTFDRVANEGGEGIVCKRADSVFSFGKRNSDLLKLKLELSIEATVVSIEETTGKKGNYALTLISKRENGAIIRTLGNHRLREEFKKSPSSIVGKIITINAMEELDGGILRHPVFSHVRYDLEGNTCV